jgi:hypothetical protein
MIRTIVLLPAIYLALLLQEFLPPAGFLAGAHLLLVPVLFCYGALRLPFPAMLGLAVFTGLLSDLAGLHSVGEHVEIGLGWSILFYVLVGTGLHLAQMAFPEGRWEIHCLASAVATGLLLLAQYLMVCLRRESFYFDGTVFWHIVGPALVALFLAPPIWFLFNLLPSGSPSRIPGRAGRVMR